MKILIFVATLVFVNTMSKAPVTQRPIRIIFAEDHVSVRQGYVSLLKEVKDFAVIGEAGNGKELLSLLEYHIPDVIVLDLEMPGMNGLEALEIVKKRYTEIRIVFFSMHYSPGLVSECLLRGASAFLPKSCAIEELSDTIHKVVNEGYCTTREVSLSLVSSLHHEKKLDDILKQLALSEREIEVLKLICVPMSNKEIAEKLGISVNTVDFHRKNIYRKTDTSSIVALIKYAIRQGVIPLD